jgi:hypothetical protein
MLAVILVIVVILIVAAVVAFAVPGFRGGRLAAGRGRGARGPVDAGPRRRSGRPRRGFATERSLLAEGEEIQETVEARLTARGIAPHRLSGPNPPTAAERLSPEALAQQERGPLAPRGYGPRRRRFLDRRGPVVSQLPLAPDGADRVVDPYPGVDPRVAPFPGADPRVAPYSGVDPRVDAYSGVDPRVDAYSGVDPRVDAYSGVDPRVDPYPGVDPLVDPYGAPHPGGVPAPVDAGQYPPPTPRRRKLGRRP